jgi:hypothetical protein
VRLQHVAVKEHKKSRPSGKCYFGENILAVPFQLNT